MSEAIRTIGVLTSGGDAPGMNAAVRAVVRTALAAGCNVKGIQKGYHGLLKNEILDLNKGSVADKINRGGTFLGTARSEEFRTEEGQQKAAEICREVLGDEIPVSVSCEIGSMGLIERENATILNAALVYVAQSFTEGFAKSLTDMGITSADIYLSQNDGTLMTMEHARRYPVLTIACGPTNSIRGASYLSQKGDALVVDVGGTTTDLGMIQNGFPRESSIAATIGGVRTNFRMPDVVTIGLGGGSIVRENDDGIVTVGPDSVGFEITDKALVFGGDVMTATDIAVRLGMFSLGDPDKVKHIHAICAITQELYDNRTMMGSDKPERMRHVIRSILDHIRMDLEGGDLDEG